MIGISELLGVQKMTVEEVEFSKTLMVAPLDTVSFKRYFVSNKYVFPVTLEVYGLAGDIPGMSIKVYDPENPNDDSNGQFLVLLNTFPRQPTQETKKKRKRDKTSITPEEYKSMHGIIDILEQQGFDIIFKNALKWTSEGTPTVQRVSLSKTFQPRFSEASANISLSDLIA